MIRDVYTAREIARLVGRTKSTVLRRSWREDWKYDVHISQGGTQNLYHIEDLPPDIQAALLAATTTRLSGTTPTDPPSSPDTDPQPEYDAEALWAWAETRPQRLRDLGASRARVIARVERLMQADGTSFRAAALSVAAEVGVSAGTLSNWYYGRGRPGARTYRPQDRAAALIPGWVGRRKSAQIPDSAWDWFRTYYLSRNQPTLAEAWRRTVETALAQGWGELPSVSTFRRRLRSETSVPVRTYLREGPEALARLHPPQRRDRRAIPAGQAAVGDGLKFDRLWVEWPDGEVVPATTGWFWSDLRTGYLAAWRLAKTETTDLFRLATYDLTAVFCPDRVWVDNTMVAASKAMTGRAPGRRRGRDRDTDPIGLLLQLGIDVRWVTPGSARRLTESQRGLLLRVPEVVRADRARGEIRIRAGRGPGGRHRYWHESLLAHKGRQVIAYYDPESLTDPISVTTLDGRLIGRAEHLADVGFEDTASAGEWARAKTRFRTAARRAAAAERRLKETEMAAQYPAPDSEPAPEPGVVSGNFGQRRRLVEGEVVEGRPLRRAVGGYEHEDDPLVSRADDLILRMGSRLRRRREEE